MKLSKLFEKYCTKRYINCECICEFTNCKNCIKEWMDKNCCLKNKAIRNQLKRGEEMRIRIDKADELFSKYIRAKAGYKCEQCMKYYPDGKGLQASHYLGRRFENTRYDEENVSCVCFSCHQKFHENPESYRAFMLKKLGNENELNKLQIRANAYKKKNRKMELIKIKVMLKELENDN